MSALAPRAQARVLAARMVDITLAEWPTALLLVAQAPFIGWLCQLVWASVETDTPSLRFVLALSAVWFGCINACREIVRERPILERERLFGLSLPAYVAARLAVLSGLGLVQVLLLQLTVEWSLSLRGFMPAQLLALWGASVCGAGLGLVVSALSRSQSQAVASLIPILLPQILFSEVAVPREQFTDLVDTVEKLMPVYWAWRVFDETAAVEPAWGAVLLSLAVLALYALALAGLATLALVPRPRA